MAKITTLSQVVEVTEVGGLDLTEVEVSGATGLYTRELRVYSVADNGGRGALVAAFRITSASEAGVTIKLPEAAY